MGKTDHGAPIDRLPTGVAGLDVVLRGGYLRGGVYLLMGRPGSGKTILSNQMCFSHAASGGRAVYVTLLSESHGRMLNHLSGMGFFSAEAVGDSVSYLSAFKVFEHDKLPGLLSLLRRTVRDTGATMLVIDGMITGPGAESELAMKMFVHELKAFVEMVGCTAFVLTSADAHNQYYPARTMVDGLINLTTAAVGMRTVREIEVAKMRGSDALMGRHLFDISDAGITVHPRLEALPPPPEPAGDGQRRRMPVDGAGLDRMLGGGLPAGSAALLLGEPGTGKTLLGLEFLAQGARQGERGLYQGFYESAERIVSKGQAVGLPLQEHRDRKLLSLQWTPPLEVVADAVAGDLLRTVREDGVQRVVLDGVAAFRQAMVYPERLGRFFTALINELRALGVTTVVTEENPVELQPPRTSLSALFETVLTVRHVELGGHRRRFVSIVKMREGGHETSIRELAISDDGLEVGRTLDSIEP